DPGEKTDVSSAHPEIVEELTRAHGDWFEDMRKTREFEPPRVRPGTPHDDPMVLTRQDRRGPRAGEPNDARGGWLIELEKETTFAVPLRFRAPGAAVRVSYVGAAATREVEVDADATMVVLKGVPHPAGPGRIGAAVLAAKPYGVDFVELKRVD